MMGIFVKSWYIILALCLIEMIMLPEIHGLCQDAKRLYAFLRFFMTRQRAGSCTDL
jgi:hypothetical protein